MFQKVNDWLADKGDRFARGGDANRTPNGAYYASSEAEQAYGGMRAPVRNPAPSAAEPANTPPADPNDKYDGRVPYKSQKDLQAEAETRRQQMEDQARRQQAAQQQRQAQPFGRVPAQQAAYPQAQGNVVPFPGMIRGPEGRLYAHVEYVVLLRSRNECTKVIEYIKANASVFLNMEFIANDSERQRCVDMLSGAAYTLGCALNKISQRGIYLISSPSVRVEIDPALQKFASVPEAQGYVRPEYAAYGGAAGYGARAPAYASQGGGYAAASGARAAAYAAQGASGYGAHAAQPAPAGRGGYAAGSTGAYAAQSAGGYAAGNTGAYAAQPAGGYAAGSTGAYAAQPAGGYAAGNTGAYAAQPAGGYAAGNTGAYAAQPAGGYAAGNTGAYAAQPAAYARPGSAASGSAETAQGQPRRAAVPPLGMQGAFTRRAERSAAT